jgi:hypothetical protein
VSANPHPVDAGLRYAFQRLHTDEVALAAHLTHLGEQHRSEHEIHHVTRDLLIWSQDNLALIQELAEQHGIGFFADSDEHPPAVPSPQTRRPSPSVPGEQEPTRTEQQPPNGLRLLDDLRIAHLLAAAVSLSWELLAQYAQARHEMEMLRLTARCHPRTLRQMRWANTMLKTHSPQALTAL